MKLILVFVVTLSCRSTVSFERERLVVWNIGQGSWATYVGTSSCDHFDAGGDTKFVPRVLTAMCFSRSNRVFVSHTDWDHVSHLKDIYRSWKSVCIVARPRDLALKKLRTRQFMERLPICETTAPVGGPGGENAIREVPSSGDLKRANDLSRIYELKDKWLFPGDSTSAAEKVWSENVPPTIQFLALGHHGSRTSTSEQLLSRLPHLRMAIASARFARYGHPHAETRERLRRHMIPLLVTEDWGDLVFEL